MAVLRYYTMRNNVAYRSHRKRALRKAKRSFRF